LSSENLHFKERFEEKKADESIIENMVLLKRFADVAGLKNVEANLSSDIEAEETKFNEELEKRKKYRVNKTYYFIFYNYNFNDFLSLD